MNEHTPRPDADEPDEYDDEVTRLGSDEPGAVHPVNWNLLLSHDLEQEWLALNRWVEWLRKTYALPASVIPPCWHRHPELQWELSALHLHWLGAYDPEQNGSAPIGWHRDFALARARLRDWVAASGTRLDRDRPSRQTAWPGERPAAHRGHADRQPARRLRAVRPRTSRPPQGRRRRLLPRSRLPAAFRYRRQRRRVERSGRAWCGTISPRLTASRRTATCGCGSPSVSRSTPSRLPKCSSVWHCAKREPAARQDKPEPSSDNFSTPSGRIRGVRPSTGRYRQDPTIARTFSGSEGHPLSFS